jgi:hypothetical protein
MLSFEEQMRNAKNAKFKALFKAKPELNPVITCGFSEEEGCDDCPFIKRCVITTKEIEG